MQPKKRHTTIAENADEDMLQSCFDRQFRFNNNIPRGQERDILSSESDLLEDSQDSHSEGLIEASNINESLVHIELNRYNSQPLNEVSPNELSKSGISFLKLNSEEEAFL